MPFRTATILCLGLFMPACLSAQSDSSVILAGKDFRPSDIFSSRSISQNISFKETDTLPGPVVKKIMTGITTEINELSSSVLKSIGKPLNSLQGEIKKETAALLKNPLVLERAEVVYTALADTSYFQKPGHYYYQHD